MCGIAGIIRFDDQHASEQDVHHLLDYVRHRGPDGEQIRVVGPCAFGHTRLSIIDLEGGLQPMQAKATANNGTLTVVFNGEIYNHRELRTQLEKFGHQFRTDHSDTEVLLFAYRQWGPQFTKRLRGMFSFALWDDGEKKLLLARDRIGQKPLFFRQNGKATCFASQIPPLLTSVSGGVPSVNQAALLTYLRLGYTSYDSLLTDIHELLPGHYMLIDQQTGKHETTPFWRLPEPSKHSSDLNLVEDTTALIKEAIHYRLEADVPLGAFLSGGIDSSLVTWFAHQELMRRGQGPLKTFSVKMPVVEYDESDAARMVAQHTGTDHTELQASPDNDVFSDLKFLISVYGEPTADSSILPTYWLSKATRQHLRVALSGDGGDELFGGYDRYRAMRLLHKHSWWLKHVPSDMLNSSNPKSKVSRVKRLIDAARQKDAPTQYKSMMHLFNEEQIRELGMENNVSAAQPYVAMPQWPEGTDPVHAAMRWDLMHYLPMEVLRKVDRASMAVGLEVRCPLLDSKVCELATHLPPDLIMPAGKPKGLLRLIAAQVLPKEIVKRRKQGFALPIGHWFKTQLREPAHAMFHSGILGTLGLDENVARRMLDEHVNNKADHTHRLFALLELTIWKQWVDHPTPPPPAKTV
ncbi:MAG TPA: asparagine synthase (glutamine-hydrolyzing) [Phycisphaerales bacterium]|nr:asparagine synthase (glutamine-hydrolyzing) [Phycisphaerales bacterium]HCD35266.1 asparagine synthase (glutamine-hydrolyzing) [Phycisphaerales bacterium]|tara:strand:- start:56268 stop:58172 length:1905 start_codon:yes stop_codon:yes gene_type:complete